METNITKTKAKVWKVFFHRFCIRKCQFCYRQKFQRKMAQLQKSMGCSTDQWRTIASEISTGNNIWNFFILELVFCTLIWLKSSFPGCFRNQRRTSKVRKFQNVAKVKFAAEMPKFSKCCNVKFRYLQWVVVMTARKWDLESKQSVKRAFGI